MVLVGVAGCDKLAGLISSSSPKATVTEPASSPMPLRPHILPDEILAKVNDRIIGTRDLELTLQDLKSTTDALGRTWTTLPAESQPDQYDLHDLLDELILAEVRAQDSVARGLDRKTDVQTRFWVRYRNFFSQEWVSWQLEQVKQEIGEQEVEEYYTANRWIFRDPAKIRVRQLMVSAEDQAKAALVKLLEGVEFATVAQQMSVRPEAAQSPLVEQWVMRGAEKATFVASTDESVRALDPVLEQGAFAIDKVGGISSYLKGADGNFHIFQLVERQDGREKPLAEVADPIRNLLRLQKLSEKSDALRKNAKIDTFVERLSNVHQP
ncbi:MAG: peptidyl-prolyl cis-trans isomerase [Candidatus Omnitrophica bacterium]|nr:peptidyl-prolyl cis-trans isomerase [Candidatus Omnitrophota bacterium]